MMKTLVINTGSTSIKYKLFEMETEAARARGLVERIGEAEGRLIHEGWAAGGWRRRVVEQAASDHRAGMELIVAALTDPVEGAIRDVAEIEAVGHRVVHGGEAFTGAAIIDAATLAAIRAHVPLAPLHNPPNLVGIEVAQTVFPHATQVAVFDTAFHQTLPPHAFRYALPAWTYHELGARRYGFHGSSHRHVARRAAQMLGRRPEELNLITVHLGAGCSITAIRAGQSVDTSMGMTPLEGLVMAQRSGDLDPAIIFHLAAKKALGLDQIKDLLNQESGLKGLTGETDMRAVLARLEAGDPDAELAVELYCYRVKKYVGAYYAALGTVDAVVLTGGVGENAAEIRRRALSGLERLGLILDPAKNQATSAEARHIGADSSPVKILVIPTDEELEIARQTLEALDT